jgi:hypothetical protein
MPRRCCHRLSLLHCRLPIIHAVTNIRATRRSSPPLRWLSATATSYATTLCMRCYSPQFVYNDANRVHDDVTAMVVDATLRHANAYHECLARRLNTPRLNNVDHCQRTAMKPLTLTVQTTIRATARYTFAIPRPPTSLRHEEHTPPTLMPAIRHAH